MLRLASGILLAVLAVTSLPATLEAQYFGRNKVQYDQFDFKVLETENFQLHAYPEAGQAIDDVARQLERWYERYARLFQHELSSSRPFILYANHPDFQQTNILQGMVGEGTGGVTEGLRDRVIMPLGASYADTDHVMGHEIVHSFQFDIAGSSRGGGLQGLMRLPLWFVEGMAEYLSLGGESSHTAMWMRDSLLRDELPTTALMTREQQRYFPYRFGHAFMAWVGGTFGDDAVVDLLRVATRGGWQAASTSVLGMSPDTVSARWQESIRDHYTPLMEGKTSPGEAGTLLLSPETGAGRTNLAPSLSPDGSRIAFLSERDLFSIDLFLADARTGEIIRRLTRSTRDAHFDAIRFLDSAGGWSPDGTRLAAVVFADGRNRIQIYRADDGRRDGQYEVAGEIGEVRGPTWMPDGESIVFSGQADGRTDLFQLHLESGETRRLTDDRHAALQPTPSPDGRHVAYVTDLGPNTNFDNLTFGRMAIGLLDMETLQVERLAPLGDDAAHWNPQFTPDGQSLFFLADPDDFRDIYRYEMATGDLRRATNIATGVSGITASTPALSVAREAGTVAFTVFDGGEYHVYALDQAELDGEAVARDDVAADARARRLPGAPGPGEGRLERLLNDPEVGLPGVDRYRVEDARPYSRRLGLEYISQATAGVGTGQFGTFIAGSIVTRFSDMLGNQNLTVGVQAQGEIQDIGGQVIYENLERRFDWGLAGGMVPQRFLRSGFQQGSGGTEFIEITERIRQTFAQGIIRYPFSQVRRAELSGGFTRYGFSREADIFPLNPAGQIVDFRRESLPAPDALSLGSISLAFVEDNSFFGFTAPIRGWRGRYEVSQTVGSVGFTQLLLDHRRYMAPHRNLTLATRGLHLGRYGLEADGEGIIRPFFLGQDGLVRGYQFQSFQFGECTPQADGSCPEFDRLEGQRVAVVNVEARIPFLGTEQLGIFETPLLPVDLVAFTDVGVAWDAGDGADLRFDRRTTDRVPVVSSGFSARTNLFGAFILEAYYAYPWQRPDRGWHWGFNLIPGW
ncbi:MAG: peptidase S9 [Gemmatimonadales bacterium]|nr:MAG: peptidase S9 [Gemmatimonadales bacterium]